MTITQSNPSTDLTILIAIAISALSVTLPFVALWS